jgi:hypothetical protein
VFFTVGIELNDESAVVGHVQHASSTIQFWFEGSKCGQYRGRRCSTYELQAIAYRFHHGAFEAASEPGVIVQALQFLVGELNSQEDYP